MSFHSPEHDPTFHESLVGVHCRAGATNCRLGSSPAGLGRAWAFLHGAVMLQAAQVLGGLKPASGLEFGFEAWLTAASARGKAIQAPAMKTAKKKVKRKVSPK